MKNIIKLLVFTAVICSFQMSRAQMTVNSSENAFWDCFEAGINGGISQYRGDYHAFMDALKNFDYKPAFGLSVRYNFNSQYNNNTLSNLFDRRVSLMLGVKKMKASSNKDNYSDVMSMDILEMSAMVQVNVLKYWSKKNITFDDYRITPYGEFGFALTGFKCDNSKDLTLPSGQNFADDSYSFKPAVILGWGLKMNIAKGITAALDGSYRFTFSDDVDHLDTRTTRNDQYYFVGAEVMFNIGEIFSSK